MIFPPDDEIRQYAAYYIKAVGIFKEEYRNSQGRTITPSSNQSKFFDRELGTVEGELDFLAMNEFDLLHESLGDVQSSLAVSANVNPPYVFDLHPERNCAFLINLANSVHIRKDYISQYPYRFVRDDKLWRVIN